VLHRDVLDVFMLSMNPRYKEQAPNFLNTEQSLRWAESVGVREYNWQSATSREGGVYRYKAEWGSRELPYFFLTWRLCNPAKLSAIGIEGAKREYGGHYLVPFGAFSEPQRRRFGK
jgi:hypothetical protein